MLTTGSTWGSLPEGLASLSFVDFAGTVNYSSVGLLARTGLHLGTEADRHTGTHTATTHVQ